jgi:hypothetical protein
MRLIYRIVFNPLILRRGASRCGNANRGGDEQAQETEAEGRYVEHYFRFDGAMVL